MTPVLGGENDALRTILVADDNHDVVFIVSQVLESAGYTVVSAHSVREALDLLDEKKEIELVLSDVRMPGQDGFDLLRVLRHRFPAMPVILMTGLPITDDDIVPAGASILQKPIDIDELERVVKEKVGQRSH